MLKKFYGSDTSYHMRVKYNVFDISIIIISINIEKLTKGAENSEIRTYNEKYLLY